jgi:hypothetical protein
MQVQLMEQQYQQVALILVHHQLTPLPQKKLVKSLVQDTLTQNE